MRPQHHVEDQRAGADPDALGQLLRHARQAGGAAQHPRRHIGIGQCVEARHLQRAKKSAGQQGEKDHIMRRRRPEERIAEQKGAADHRIGDKHGAKAEGTNDRRDDRLVRHRAGGAREGDEPR